MLGQGQLQEVGRQGASGCPDSGQATSPVFTSRPPPSSMFCSQSQQLLPWAAAEDTVDVMAHFTCQLGRAMVPGCLAKHQCGCRCEDVINI